MHSRIFYYARIRGLSIPYAPYRDWLREQILLSDTNSNHQPPRIWEWDLLTSLCNHRDRLAASSTTTSFSSSRPPTTNQPEAVAEKDLWTRSLLEDGALRAARAEAAATAPAWMAAAPRGELCVDRDDEKDDEADGQVPYPERFAAIIKAVQTGERIEGILEIPDVVVRNPVGFDCVGLASLVLWARLLTWLEYYALWQDEQAAKALGVGSGWAGHHS